MKLLSFNILRRPARRAGQRGVALIITLILLSVTLLMALAFLALSTREREANATATDQTQARLAAESALAAAQSQIIANMYATKNAAAYNFGLMVSTNYTTDGAFDPTLGYSTNKNVNYFTNGVLLSGADLAQNIANLQILPRVPVFLATGGPGADFRYYLDLNRNGRYDTNGLVMDLDALGNPFPTRTFSWQVGDPEWVGVLEHPNQLHSPVNKFVSRYAFVAVPAGNTLDINAIHNQALNGPNNAALAPMDAAVDGYYRNQGVGSWELNLAAFLVDLNTNVWAGGQLLPNNLYYAYNESASSPNLGIAFNDAFAIYTNRLLGYYSSLTTANNYFGNTANQADYFAGTIDAYDTGNPLNNFSSAAKPWLGADNRSHYFSLPDELLNYNGGQSLADPPALPTTFVNRLLNAGKATDTYDRYTFYRLLAQLGTDSAPDRGKLNLNYINVDTNGSIIPGMETNLMRWTNAQYFFVNAADRLVRYYTTNWFERSPSNFLATYYGVYTNYNNADGYGLTNFPYYGVTNQVPAFCLTNIPVYVRGQFVYSPAVNRLMQLAANIYDAQTNDVYPNFAFYPSVFRPYFRLLPDGTNTDVFIAGYLQVTNANVSIMSLPYRIPEDLGQLTLAQNNYVNLYGVPWIIGAKKGFPSFNQLAMQNQVTVTRKIQFNRGYNPQNWGKLDTYTTNVCYEIGITNYLSAGFWNPYSSNYPGTLNYYAYGEIQMGLSNVNTSTSSLATNNYVLQPYYTGFGQPRGYEYQMAQWPGSQWPAMPAAPSFLSARLPSAASFTNILWSYSFLPSQSFYPSTRTFPGGTNYFDPAQPMPVLSDLTLTTSNWFYSYILDGSHVVDLVAIKTPVDSTNLALALSDYYYSGAQPLADQFLWATNTYNGEPYGLYQQAVISLQNSSLWSIPPPAPLNNLNYVNAFFANDPANNSEPSMQAALSPTRVLYCPYLFQANDPLVHYTTADLGGLPGTSGTWAKNVSFQNGLWRQYDVDPVVGKAPSATGAGTVSSSLAPPNLPSPGALPGRYQPWGYLNQMKQFTTNTFDWAIKDPLVWGADNWNFPNSLFPTVGWLGRVHRGTPWQTVYLKARDILAEASQPNYAGPVVWANWLGDPDLFDATNAAPVEDRLLFDIFTTKLNDNASLGTLSVNQTNLAAWSAVFSGMTSYTNTVFNQSTAMATTSNTVSAVPLVISPAAGNVTDSALWKIYSSINATRAVYTNGVFPHLGDVLSSPALSDQSPFINMSGTLGSRGFQYPQSQYGVNEELMEWLPQQAVSLLRLSDTPRYVIYGYGQALRPAPNSFYTAGTGSLYDLVTNYQVVAETGLRAVVQVHPQVTATPNGYVTNYTTTVESYNLLPPQ